MEKILPNRIKDLRLALGYTQEELGERAGYSDAQIKRLEAMDQNLTTKSMMKIAEALAVTPLELLGGVPIRSPLEAELLRKFRKLDPLEQDYTIREMELRKDVLDGKKLRSQVANPPSQGGGDEYNQASNH